MGWWALGGAILAEAGGTTAMRAATLPQASWCWWGAVAVGYGAAFGLFALALAHGVGLSAGYAIWAGVGVALTALIAWAVFGERPSIWAIAGLILITAGVALVEAGGAATGSHIGAGR